MSNTYFTKFCPGYYRNVGISIKLLIRNRFFLVISDRGDRYLSDALGLMKNIIPSQSYNRLEVSTTVYCNCNVRAL